MQALQALIAQYVQARAEAQVTSVRGFEHPAYVAACTARTAAFKACLECCMGQPITTMAKAFAMVDAARR